MDPRPDITNKLIHFTSGNSFDEAFDRLQRIVDDCCLIGSGEKIRGSYRCVCFTEAPLTSLQHGLVNPSAYTRYSPFGIMFEKQWLYEQGGRPVIYQPETEFGLLPNELRWRHVRYEPGVSDFTWEREWRIHTDELHFSPNVAGIVVPEEKWARIMIGEHNAEQDYEVQRYSQIMDEMLAEQYRERFPWRIFVLG